MLQKHTGSCVCNTVRFELEGEFEKFFLCHCSRCQKMSGSAHCANLFAPKAKLTWLSGQSNINFYQLEGTKFARNFCSTCSTLLPLHVKDRDIVIVPAGCLDTNVEIKPQAHIFTDSKSNWDNVLNDIPCFEQLPQ